MYRTITVYGSTFQRILLIKCLAISWSYNPTHAVTWWFGLFPVRSPLLGESLLFSFPTGTKMFQFPALASIKMDDIPSECRVVPFGNLWIKGYLHLPEAYRSLSRPSSPPRAKASAMRPCLLSFKLTFSHIYTIAKVLIAAKRTVRYILLALY